INDFVVSQPAFGTQPTSETVVKIAYDNTAIYFAIIAFDKQEDIRKQFTARDRESRQDCDYVSVTLDTYNDKQNAFQFIVTTANVQSDIRISSTSSSNNGNFDYNWDAVWDSKVSFFKDGWITEIKIPYMSLRFAPKTVQDWGMNVGRFMRRNNEFSTWNPINPQIAGIVNQNGILSELKDLTPPLRLNFLPYISGGYSVVPTQNGVSTTVLRNGGMDVKYGINESFTMDMTLIPDFGQVQSDNVVLNLSPFEIQFNENRPFFTEGTELFNKAGIFYSRRVGRTPEGYYAAKQLASDSGYTILRNPTQTQLYNATKFSGRTNKNLGIGFFNAITAPMYAEMIDEKGNIFKMKTETGANYNILVFDQALKNRSSIAFTNTNVYRGTENRNANVASVDMSLFDKNNTYNLRFSGKWSQIYGSENYGGYKSNIFIGKVSGNWQWGVTNNIESKRYDPNDLGYLQAPNEFTTTALLSYNQFTPNKYFNYRNYDFRIVQRNLLVPFAYSEIEYRASFLHVFKNFWDLRLVIDGSPFRQYDYFELRKEGAKFQKLPWQYLGIYGSTDSRKKLYIGYGGGYGFLFDRNLPYINFYSNIRYRFNNRLTIQLESNQEQDKGEFGWSHNDVLTGEPIVGQRTMKRLDNILNINYNFQSRMNLIVRARHFWSKVTYERFFNVDNLGNWEHKERAFESG
ncbi:MAG: DUF5916 domain-containing protein, partial [Chitinophagaceae bacterium]